MTPDPYITFLKPALGTVLFWFLLAFTPDGILTAQDDRYTFTYRHITLDEALQRLSDEAGVSFIYQSGLTRNIRVNGTARDQTVRDILDNLLLNTPLQYRKSDTGTYVIFRPVTGIYRHGAITGNVSDASTGESLDRVNVYIEALSRGVSTGPEGQYDLQRLQPGTHQIQVSHVGYRTLTTTVEVLPGMENVYTFSLEPAMVAERRVIVTDALSPLQYMRAGSDITEFEAFFIQNPAGTPDAMRPLGDVPGVRFNSPLADLSLQGSPSTQHRVELDGTLVFSPLSMGRLLSAFSPFAVRRLTLHSAGFGASAGSSLSGVVAVEQAASLPGADPFLVQTDFNSLNLRGLYEWEPASGYRLYTMAAIRHQTPWISLNPSVRQTIRAFHRADPLLYSRQVPDEEQPQPGKALSREYRLGFYDLHFSGLLRHPDLASTSLNLYAGRSTMKPAISTESTPTGRFGTLRLEDDYRWHNRLANVSHAVLLSDNAGIRGDVSVSYHEFGHEFNGIFEQPGLSDNPPLYEHNMRHQATLISGGLTYMYEWDVQTSLESGFSANFTNIFLEISDFPGSPLFAEIQQRHFSGFTEIRYGPSPEARLVGGLRYTLVPGLGLYFEPRISYGIDIRDSGSGNWSFLLSGGLFREYLQQLSFVNTSPSGLYPELVFWMPVSHTGRVPSSRHVSLDVRWEPLEQLLFRIEPYFKWQPSENIVDYTQVAGIRSSSSDAFTNARTRTAGIGISGHLERSRHRISLLYHYSHVRRQIRDRFDGRFIQPYWAEPHQIVLSGQISLTSSLTLNSRLELLPGRRTWAFRRAYYDVLAQQSDSGYSSLFDTPQNDKLDLYSQFDLGLSWTRRGSFAHWTVTGEIRNLFAHRNEFDRGFNERIPLTSPDDSGSFYHRAPRHIQPGISIQATF